MSVLTESGEGADAHPEGAKGSATTAPSRLLLRYRMTPWWLRVIVVFALSRVVTTVIVLLFARAQGANPWTGANPPYLSYAAIWDGNWYKIISFYGYPSVLPVTADGHVGESAWAFMPAYPFLISLLRWLTGGRWELIAVVISIACALGTALVFYKLMRHVLKDEGSALFSVVLFCVAPLSPLLQFAYAESMSMLLLVSALYLVVTRRYPWVFPIVAVMALTRPTGLAFALFLVLHLVHRYLVRRTDPFPLRQRAVVASLAVFSGLMGIAWLLIAWGVTGSMSAYTDTELAWRASYIGYGELIPFTAWFQGGEWWLGSPWGYIVVALLIVGFAAFLVSRIAKRLGVDLRLWLASYALYLLAVFFPQSSTFRLLMPLFPALGALAVPRSRIYRVVLVIVAVAGQVGWMTIAWGVDGRDWTPP
ncbi:mannosyltransferase family protein [Herbiconiux sp.]|uniref:mannosyltransferase family protein n=1 Tax=Herbiconiux sp. TaxID=1871186 RepID=UPI0025B7CBD6|nr:mannosyltransferase family protein [Herbiconiux sp.]